VCDAAGKALSANDRFRSMIGLNDSVSQTSTVPYNSPQNLKKSIAGPKSEGQPLASFFELFDDKSSSLLDNITRIFIDNIIVQKKYVDKEQEKERVLKANKLSKSAKFIKGLQINNINVKSFLEIDNDQAKNEAKIDALNTKKHFKLVEILVELANSKLDGIEGTPMQMSFFENTCYKIVESKQRIKIEAECFYVGGKPYFVFVVNDLNTLRNY
jgi:hypothetical protein